MYNLYVTVKVTSAFQYMCTYIHKTVDILRIVLIGQFDKKKEKINRTVTCIFINYFTRRSV